ncbi:hypothetical protein NG99_19945 [Erwinia typographi]|uniref:DinI family protein n=1 Tax=Erwinia typographi TaxID=371042 RepID=A0A0A3YV89_9GAMM|nr:DinI-like family protein [Erwinia typographi]KGT89291.1 hypothetical protein NG99_19945 [Erwinia typographi]
MVTRFTHIPPVHEKRNIEGLSNAKEVILSELDKRVKRVFPHADVRVKPMIGNSSINSDATVKLNTVIEEVFNEADMWMGDVE